MYYVYVLKSTKNGKYYFGSTSDLKKRFYQHNHGYSTYTKTDAPWELVYYEAYCVKSLALKRELKIKQYGQTWRRLKERIDLTE